MMGMGSAITRTPHTQQKLPITLPRTVRGYTSPSRTERKRLYILVQYSTEYICTRYITYSYCISYTRTHPAAGLLSLCTSNSGIGTGNCELEATQQFEEREVLVQTDEASNEQLSKWCSFRASNKKTDSLEDARGVNFVCL